MSLGKLGTLAVAGSIAASWAFAQEWNKSCKELNPLNAHQTHTVKTWDTLSCIADATWNRVSTLIQFNWWLHSQHSELCNWDNKLWGFCDKPEDTLMPGNIVQIPWNSNNLTWQLIAGWISTEEIEKILPLVEQWIINFPWLSVENAVSVVTKLNSIPQSANVWLLLDVSWSANDDRDLIKWFTDFFLNDRKLAWNTIDESWDTMVWKITTYEYWKDGYEYTIQWINDAYTNGADYVVAITDEPWDGSWETKNIDTTTIFMIQDEDYCPNKCWDANPNEINWDQSLSEHWEVIYLKPSK